MSVIESEQIFDTLRIGMAGRWSVNEFAQWLLGLQFIYDLVLLSDEARSRPNGERLVAQALRTAVTAAAPAYRLHDVTAPITRIPLVIRGINYSSPGISDLSGLGKALEEIRKFVTDILDRYLQREDRRITRAIAREDLKTRKIKNVELLVDLYRKVGLTEDVSIALREEVQSLDSLVDRLVLEGKIISVETESESR
jgi:hypothetical protein